MPASIHTLLADELDISEPMAEKLLSAMLREVRKRAAQGGVRLPDLGKFKVEDGELTFHPADGLAQAVNHRFEGLQSEDLRGAPEPDTDEEQDPEGPSTITLGYQDSSGWSPLDAEDESEQEPETAEDEPAEEEESADTEEFEMPTAGASPDEGDDAPSASTASRTTEETESTSSATEADRAGSKEPPPAAESDTPSSAREPDTEEISPEPTSAPDDAEEPPDTEETSDTEELYPLVDDMSDAPSEDAPDSESETASAASAEPSDSATSGSETDEERDELSKIWGSDPEEEPDEETTAFSADSDLDEETSPDTGDTALDDIPTDPEPATETDEPTLSEVGAEDEDETTAPESTETEPTRQPSPPSESGSSTLPRVLVTLLVLMLLGGGAWYILGQRGLVPSPGQTVSQLSGASASTGSDPQAAGPAPSSTDGTSEQDAPSSSEVSDDASDETAAPSSDAAEADGIDPAAGGWTIVVASRADRDAATALIDTYRQRFEAQTMPVDVLQGTVDNTTRYRVAVGQFASRSEAQSFLDDNSDALPSGAWPLDLQ